MADKRPPITAAPPVPLGERRTNYDADLAREIDASIGLDSEAALAAAMGVSADIDPPSVAPPPGISLPVEEPNPDDDGKLQQEIDAQRSESARQAAVRKSAVAEHIADIDSDADHPLRGAATRARVPFGSRSQRLAAPRREGFHRHWFNDIPGRIEKALRSGYKMVIDVDGKPMQRVVGVGQDFKALHGFYMEIPVEWYVKDMRESRKSADDLEMTIRQGKLGNVEKQYTPKSGIEYEEEAGGSYQPRV